MDTLQSAIRATKITTSRKQSIFFLTRGRGARVGRGGRGRGGGCGNHYQNKRPYKGGRGARGARGRRGSSDKRVRLNDHGKPPHVIDWVKDEFYEPGFYVKFLAKQKTQLHELQNNRRTTTPATQKVASVE